MVKQRFSSGFGKDASDPFIIEAVKKEQSISKFLAKLNLKDLQNVSDVKSLIKRKGGLIKMKETLSDIFVDVDNAWASAGVYEYGAVWKRPTILFKWNVWKLLV